MFLALIGNFTPAAQFVTRAATHLQREFRSFLFAVKRFRAISRGSAFRRQFLFGESENVFEMRAEVNAPRRRRGDKLDSTMEYAASVARTNKNINCAK